MRLRRFAAIPAAVLGTIVVVAGLVGGLVAANGDPPMGYQTVTTVTASSTSNRVVIGVNTVKLRNLKATLTNGTSPLPTPGATITFTIQPRRAQLVTVCTAVTNTKGVATCSGSVPRQLMVGVRRFTASFSGTTDLAPSSASGRLNS